MAKREYYLFLLIRTINKTSKKENFIYPYYIVIYTSLEPKMIEKKYKIRRSSTKDETAEVTIPIGWRRYHKISFGDEVKLIANGIIMILPPDISEEAEEKARDFLEGKGK